MATEKRTIDIRIRVSEAERALYEGAAKSAGMTVSAWMRMLATKESRRKRNA